MSPEPKTFSVEILEESLGSLSGCLVDGDAEQRTRERRNRRRALGISILLQSAVLATLILVPFFGKAEHIALAIATPVPPYSRYRNVPQNPGAPRPHPSGTQDTCRFCAPLSIPRTVATHDADSLAGQTDDTLPEMIGEGIPGGRDGIIPLSDSRQRVLPPNSTERHATRPQVVHVTNLDPVYPPLARQTHREGRVELRAIIGIDGTIQSLQIVASDPLFDLSAREAVQQWRYRPTILNGQPVEIDTYITVIYTTQH